MADNERQPLLKADSQAVGGLDEFGDEILFRGEYSNGGIGGAYYNYFMMILILIMGIVSIPCILLIPICYLAHKERWRLRFTSKGIYCVQPWLALPWCTGSEQFIAIRDISSIRQPCGGAQVTVVERLELREGSGRYIFMNVKIGPMKNWEQLITAFESERQRQGML